MLIATVVVCSEQPLSTEPGELERGFCRVHLSRLKRIEAQPVEIMGACWRLFEVKWKLTGPMVALNNPGKSESWVSFRSLQPRMCPAFARPWFRAA